MPGRDLRRLKCPAQCGQRLGGLASLDPALSQGSVQINAEIRFDHVHQRIVRHLLGFGRIADPIERVGQPTDKDVVPGRADWTARHRLIQQFGGNFRSLAN